MRKAIIGAAAGLGALLSLVSVGAQGVSVTTDASSYTLDPQTNAVDVVVTASGLPAACEGLDINLRITATADGSGTANASRPATVTGGTATATIPYPGIAGVGTRYAGAANRSGEECLETSPIVGSSFEVTQDGGPTETPTSEPTDTPTSEPTDTPTTEPTETSTEPTSTGTATGTSTSTATGTSTPKPPDTGLGGDDNNSAPLALIALGAIAALAVGSAGYVLRARR